MTAARSAWRQARAASFSRLLLRAIQWLAVGSGNEMLVTALAGVPGWRIVLAPALGGLAIVAAKVAATAISLGSGFGGGVFSPSQVLGAALGGAFGHALALLFPGMTAEPGAYAVLAAAAASAPVPGAPVSTVLILLEMTEAWRLAPGAAIAVLVSTAICRPLIGRSFFTWQLRRRAAPLSPDR